MVVVADLPVAVIVFGMSGCPMCDEYAPRFRKVAATYARCVPAFVVDCNDYADVADALRVTHTPTTVVVKYGRVIGKRVAGSVDDASIERIFQRAMRGEGCEL